MYNVFYIMGPGLSCGFLAFSYNINFSSISLTECIELSFLNMQCLKITIYFSNFLKSICNALKLTLCPVQTS